VLEKGFQIRGATPRIAICSEVKYVVRCKETPRSTAMFSYAGMMEAAVKVDMQAWIATRTRFVIFYPEILSVLNLEEGDERKLHHPALPVIWISTSHAWYGI
jgi:hypothetical protein